MYNIDKHGTTFLLFYGYTVAQWAGKMNQILCCDWLPRQFKWGYLVFSGLPNGPIYIGDGWPVWDELGQRMVACLIICLCINTGKQTDHPSTQAIAIVCLVRRSIVDNLSRQMIRLLAGIYTQMDYQMSYRPLPKLVQDRWSVSNIHVNQANVCCQKMVLFLPYTVSNKYFIEQSCSGKKTGYCLDLS